MTKGDPATDSTTNKIGAWLAGQNDYDAAVWTALPPNFEEKSGVRYDVPSALRITAPLIHYSSLEKGITVRMYSELRVRKPADSSSTTSEDVK